MADRAGFTLVELALALAIGGMVVGAALLVLSTQGRFLRSQADRGEAQQNTRAALELIGSELRTIPAGNALVRAAGDSLTFRAVHVWGVVCGVGAGGIEVTLPRLDGATYTANSGTALVANVGSTAAPEWSAPIPVTAIGSPAGSCGGTPVPPGAEARLLAVALPPAGATMPEAGDPVYLYDLVTYRRGGSPGVRGVWIQRRVGDGAGSSNQPMAGPVDEGAVGLSFEYLADGSAPLATPVLDEAARRSVSRLTVIVTAVAGPAGGGAREARSDTVTITLRNRV